MIMPVNEITCLDGLVVAADDPLFLAHQLVDDFFVEVAKPDRGPILGKLGKPEHLESGSRIQALQGREKANVVLAFAIHFKHLRLRCESCDGSKDTMDKGEPHFIKRLWSRRDYVFRLLELILKKFPPMNQAQAGSLLDSCSCGGRARAASVSNSSPWFLKNGLACNTP